MRRGSVSVKEYIVRMQERCGRAGRVERGQLLDEIVAVTGMSRSSIYRLMQNGGFPRPFKIGPTAVRLEGAGHSYLGGIPACGEV